MQLEDKIVEDLGSARAESQQREDVLARGEEQLPVAVSEAVSGASIEQRGELLGAIRMVLADEALHVGELHLPAREARALVALQRAVSGRSELGAFLYASDRRDLLEQALAVLQPDLTHADARSAYQMQAQLADLTDRVGQLRHELSSLEESQDELVEVQQKATLAQGDTGDKPAAKPGDPSGPARPEAPKPATLTGAELPEPEPAPTTLTGGEAAELTRAPSTLTGSDAAEAPSAPTTLTGGKAAELTRAPTTLTGTELAEPPPPPTTLGDPAELAERAKQPWWRRPFG